jgi:transcriptional regulator with XRE-family HTH domain
MNADGGNLHGFVQSDREAIGMLLNRVRQHRLKLNWSQAELARRAGLSRPAYQNFENGYGNITLRNLVKVLGVLGLTHHLAEMVPPPRDEPTLASLTKPERQRARARRAPPAKPDPHP